MSQSLTLLKSRSFGGALCALVALNLAVPWLPRLYGPLSAPGLLAAALSRGLGTSDPG